MPEAIRQIEEILIGGLVDNSEVSEEASDPREIEDGPLTMEEKVKKTLKKRHLSRAERDAFHKPKSDWFETQDGEACRSAETLVVKDIITKFVK